MALVLGIATIGQAPRDDLAALFQAEAPPGTRVVLRGCLDGLTAAEIVKLAPTHGGETLYSRLGDGREVTISKVAVIQRASQTVARLRQDGADAVVFACTGAFPDGMLDGPVIFPSRLLHGLAQALLPKGRLGLLIPLAEQADQLCAKWARAGVEVVAEPLLPSGDAGQAEAAARRLKAHAPDLVAMDCMSYTPATKQAVRQILGVPTLLAVTTIGRILREVLE